VVIKTLLTEYLRRKDATPSLGSVVTWESGVQALPARYLGRVGNGVLIEVRQGGGTLRKIVPEYQLSRDGAPLGSGSKSAGGSPRPAQHDGETRRGR
jgi:hypothetical protein